MAEAARAQQMTAQLRVLTILRRLQRRRCAVGELAAEFGTNQKTIRRDLLTIREAGFALRSRTLARGKKTWRVW